MSRLIRVLASDASRRMAVSLLLSLVGVFCVATGAPAQTEKIDDYQSEIVVNKDGSLNVTETIRVTAAGDKIKRGIYRDFPTLYTTKYFIRIELPFKVEAVTRDGRIEPYHTENRENGVRLYIGNKNVRVPPGEHTYKILYTTNFQLGYFEKHDELYWNVTGNGWEFPIEQVTATITLPPEIPRKQITHEAYTGPQGAKHRNVTSDVNATTGTVDFKTTKPLWANEGLTIVVGFPKGFVSKPTAAERRTLYFRANLTLWIVLGGLLLVLGYYMFGWIRVGRDPPGGVIVPLFEPPEDLSPASLRYLWRMDYDRACFSAAVLNMAAKGFLTISETDGEYTLHRSESSPKAQRSGEKLAPGEKAVYKTLLSTGSITLEQSNHRKIKKSIKKLASRLAQEFDGKLFKKNKYWLIGGWLLSALVLAAAALSCGWEKLFFIAFISVWLSIWSVACGGLAYKVVNAWRGAVTNRRNTMKQLSSYGSAVFISAFSTPFFLFELAGLAALIYFTSIWMLPLLVGLLATNWIFLHLLKQPTIEGKRIMDAIEGFRMYLGTTEKEFLQQMLPPDQTPELFEKYLPYAVALGVEQAWAEQFTEVLSRAARGTDDRQGYQPAWYHGTGWRAASAGTFASGLGSSLGGAIASSSTAPGTSSGSSGFSGGGGGGGFSGGGGGGGGGGGW